MKPLLAALLTLALICLPSAPCFAQPGGAPPAATDPSAGRPPAPKPAETKPEPAKTEPAMTDPSKPDNAKPQETSVPKYEYVKMSTSMGDLIIELNNEKAPISTKNFLAYTDKKHYDGTIFHRVINDFMIQGGGFTPDMNEKSGGAGIKNEWKNGLSNKRGTLAMARLGNQPDSATAQFFINVKDNDFLDQPRDGAGYAVFGKVIGGLEVIDKIKVVKTGTKKGHGDVPNDPITITSVSRITPEDAAKLGTPSEQPAAAKK